jgi:hypothetical protein
MKRIFVKTISKKFIAAAFLASAIVFTASAESKVNSTDIDKVNSTDIELLSDTNQATVQYTGTADGAMIFSVNIPNASADKFTLTIQDADGNVLFSKEYSDKNFSKKYRLVADDSNSSYFFNIKSNNKSLEKTFAVSTVQKIIDEVVVTPL